MARLYLIEKYGLRKDIELERIQHSILSIEYSTYLAGLKAGEKLGLEKGLKAKVNMTTISDCPIKLVWHKVADGSLPKRDERFLTNVSIPILTSEYNFACYYFDNKQWYANGVKIDPPIAWCEIPKYTEA